MRADERSTSCSPSTTRGWRSSAGSPPNSLAAYRRDLRRYAAFLREPRRARPDRGRRSDRPRLRRGPEVGASMTTGARGSRRPRSPGRWSRCGPSTASASTRASLAVDPSEEVGAPRVPQGIPKALTEDEVEALLGAVVGDTARARCAIAPSSRRCTPPACASASSSASTGATSTSTTDSCASSARAARNASSPSAARPARR